MNKKAFTLIELLITASIISLVALSIYAAFTTGFLTYDKLNSAADAYQEARLTLGILEKDLKNSFAYSNDIDSKFKGGGKNLDFFSLVDSFDNEGKVRTDVCRLRYELDGGIFRRFLYRGIEALQDDLEVQGDELCAGVKEIFFEYISGSSEKPLQQDAWPDKNDSLLTVSQTKEIPKAVKIKLSLIEQDRKGRESGAVEFNRIIYLPLSE